MKRWETLVDQMVKDVIGNGDISHLHGAGKPLDLGIDEHTPDNMRIVFKIMKDHDVAPDWLMMGNTLDQHEDKLSKQIQIRAELHQTQLDKVRRKGTLVEENQLETKWNAFIADYVDRVERFNKEVLLYNLKVPKGIPHKQILNVENLIASALNDKKGD